MCGICGYISKYELKDQVISGLEKLEYRGYDSAGVAFLNGDKIECVKRVGVIKNLKDTILAQKGFSTSVMIGHTRWATHGEANETNAHPHMSNNKKIAVVHNGIIENYKILKQNLIEKGYSFYSQTDTEVIAVLIEQSCNKTSSYLEGISLALEQLEGSFAIAVIFNDEEKIYVAKNKSPLYVASSYKIKSVSSDVITFSNEYKNYYSLDDNEIAVLEKSKISFFDKKLQKIAKKSKKIDNFNDNFKKNNNSCIMRAEIEETLIALKLERLKLEKIDFLKNVSKKNYIHISFIGCGTAYHVCMFGAYMTQKYLRVSASAHIASEFRYADNILKDDVLYILVSQSGETADTIACANILSNFDTIAVTNVEYSMLAKACKFVLPIYAGREIAVASTKAYTCQCVAILCLIFSMCEQSKYFILALDELLNTYSMQHLQINYDDMNKFDKIFFIGRGVDYITCKEASLKLKEISYINCIAVPAGELKHGTLALVDEKSLIFAILTEKKLLDKSLSNMEEVKARGGKVFVVSPYDEKLFAGFYGYFKLTEVNEIFLPLISMIPFQYFALEVALRLGLNPDRPRNLAKSVTVE